MRHGEKMKKRGSAAALAELLQITARRVNQLVDEEVIVREAEGDFILPQAISAYYEFKFTDKSEIDYLAEKALHERAKRQLSEIELRKRSNEVHEAADVELVFTDMLVKLRSQLLGLPAKMGLQLANRDKDYIEQALREEINSRLMELSEYNPDMFTGDDSENAEKND